MAESVDGDNSSPLRIIIKTLLELVGLLSLWFAPSIGLTLLNKCLAPSVVDPPYMFAISHTHRMHPMPYICFPGDASATNPHH